MSRLTKIKIKLHKRDLKRVLNESKNFSIRKLSASRYSRLVYILSQARYFIDDISAECCTRLSKLKSDRLNLVEEQPMWKLKIASSILYREFYLGRKERLSRRLQFPSSTAESTSRPSRSLKGARHVAAYVSVRDRLRSSLEESQL